MIAALLYLQVQSYKNRLLLRFRRLRQPKYLIGALIGGLYFGIVFLRPFLALGRSGSAPLPAMGGELWEFIAATVLFAMMALAWLVPHGRAALIFSEAEIAFLFPAPIRRDALIHFKLIKSQTAILFTALFLTLLSHPPGGVEAALMRAMGWWLLLSIVNLHFLGSSFARTMLLERGISTWKRRAAVLALLLIALGAAGFWVRRNTPLPPRLEAANFKAIAQSVSAFAESPPALLLLLPFRIAVRPFLAADAGAFLKALGPALALLALHYLWVIRSDVAFEEASLEASRRHAARVTAVRSGRWQDARPRRRLRAPFRLSPTGSPATALLWKNLLSAGQLFSVRVWLPMAVWALIMGWTLSIGAHKTAWPQIIGAAAATLTGMSLLVGPQLVRQDFRQDLLAADLLKTYPMRGWQAALGELLAPTLILTGVQWLLLLLTASLWSGGIAGVIEDSPSLRWALAASAAIVAPALNLVTLLIPNAAALLFPAWFLGGQGGGRGIEVMGQRLIFVFGQMAVFAAAVAPAGLAFGLVYLLIEPALEPEWAALAASAFSALILTAEAACGIAGLGRLFENYDLSKER